MSKKTTISASDNMALKLKFLAKEKEAVRRKLVVTAKKLAIKAKALAVTAKEKESVRRRLVVTAKKLAMLYQTLERKVIDRTQDLEQAKAKDEAILSSIGDGVFAIDTKGTLILFNAAASGISGYSKREASGKPFHKVLRFMMEDKPNVASHDFIEQALKGKKAKMANHTILLRKDGTTVPVDDAATPIFGPDKKIIGAVVVFRDVSKECAVDRAKTEFVSLASHQLRSPLTSIRWILSTLKREKLTEEQRTMVSTAHEASIGMAAMIKKMLMISYVEEGGVAPEIVQVDLPRLLDKVSLLHDSHRQKKGVELTVQCPEDLHVRTDEQLLIEILSNLLSNAYKYTPKGGKVSVCATKEGEKIRIAVSDTGCGIPFAEQRKIPGKFFRASNITSPAESGTGIGLYMVYNIARLIGGTISFVSQENKGTTFSLLFPS